MPTYTVKVTETYENQFQVQADDEAHAQEVAEGMAIERTFPPEQAETCERVISVVIDA